MAHATDYHSMQDIHKLRLSSQPKMKSAFHGTHAETLVYNFLQENPSWAIDSLVSYCMNQYSEYGITKRIIAEQVRLYIEER